MCYSPEASFAVAGLLVPAGAYCVTKAVTRNWRLLPLAVVPLCLAAQQAAEGFVWLAMHDEAPERAVTPSLVFLFFALFFWPFWWPFVAAVAKGKSLWLWLWTAAALSWFYIHFYPLLADPSLLTVSVKHHSISYEYPGLPVYSVMPRLWVRVLYLVTIVVPLLTMKGGMGPWPGIVLAASAGIAALVYHYAFASVWCFFAAILSGYLCVVFRNLPRVTDVQKTGVE